MRILSLETSGQIGSLALFTGSLAEGLTVRHETELPEDRRTAQSLAPAIKQALLSSGWAPGSLELIAVAQGPGSFTGLRIGVTTAKTLAYAIGTKLIGVSTLAALASQAGPSTGRIWAVLDAQRGELFAQVYDAANDFALTADETRVLSVDEWCNQLQPGDAVTGLGLAKLRERLPAGIELTVEKLWQPTALAIGELAWRRFTAGQFDDVWQFVPRYYRRSAAEEKLPAAE